MTDQEIDATEESRLYHEFVTAAKTIPEKVSVMSIQSWRDEGRPTAEEFYPSLQPGGRVRFQFPDEGDSMSTAQTKVTAPETPKAPKAKSTKVLVRELFSSSSAAYTREEIMAATGKGEGSVTTAISDLKSEKYCKPGTPLVLYRWADQKYRLTAEPIAETASAAAPAVEEALPVH